MALVTGAARGIGMGIALRLAYDELDGVAGEIRDKGRGTVAISADVSEPDEVQSMVRRVADELDQLDVMVANAGIAQVIPLPYSHPTTGIA